LFEKGTRVWYHDPSSFSGRRGIITEIRWLDEATETLDFAKLLLYSDKKGVQDETVEISGDTDKLLFDTESPWVLRFQPGQYVVCFVGPHDNLTRKVGIVTQTWPTNPGLLCAQYQDEIYSQPGRGDVQFIERDTKDYVVEYKMPRFTNGD
jgi:hypothetical protein